MKSVLKALFGVDCTGTHASSTITTCIHMHCIVTVRGSTHDCSMATCLVCTASATSLASHAASVTCHQHHVLHADMLNLGNMPMLVTSIHKFKCVEASKPRPGCRMLLTVNCKVCWQERHAVCISKQVLTCQAACSTYISHIPPTNLGSQTSYDGQLLSYSLCHPSQSRHNLLTVMSTT